MSSPLKTGWDHLRSQILAAPLKSGILGVLALVLVVLVGKSLVGKTPAPATAGENKPMAAQAPSSTDRSIMSASTTDSQSTTATNAGPTKPQPPQISWATVRTELKRNPFECSWWSPPSPDAAENPSPEGADPDTNRIKKFFEKEQTVEDRAAAIRKGLALSGVNAATPQSPARALINSRLYEVGNSISCQIGKQMEQFVLIEITGDVARVKDRRGEVYSLETFKPNKNKAP